jgi:hypothetical protein
MKKPPRVNPRAPACNKQPCSQQRNHIKQNVYPGYTAIYLDFIFECSASLKHYFEMHLEAWAHAIAQRLRLYATRRTAGRSKHDDVSE